MARADVQHAANVREPAWLTLGALKYVEHPASAIAVDYGASSAYVVAARPLAPGHRGEFTRNVPSAMSHVMRAETSRRRQQAR